jgi:hypothetical protein
MNAVDPVVRHMLLCEDIRRETNNPKKIDVLGLLNTLEALEEPAFPLHLPVLCVYMEVTGGRGTGQAHIDCRQADSGRVVFSSPAHALTFPPNPLAIRGLVFRISACRFPEPGLYWIQFCYNQRMLAEQPLVVR